MADTKIRHVFSGIPVSLDLGVQCRSPETGPVIKLTCTFNGKKNQNNVLKMYFEESASTYLRRPHVVDGWQW